MRVRMNVSSSGSEDGVQIRMYEKGKEYELRDKLANIFISQGYASEISSPEEKAMGNAPENKMATEPVIEKKRKK